MYPLFAVMAITLALLGWELAPVPAEPIPPATPADSAPLAKVTDAQPVAAWTRMILARPLFAPDRRPAESTPSAPEELPRLAGTIRSDDSLLAIFAPPAGGRPIVAGRDGAVAGWSIAEITDGAVTLSRGGRVAVIRLSHVNAPTTTGAVGPREVSLLRDGRNSFPQP